MFKRRLEKPAKSNLFYYSNKNIFHRDGWDIPNCTAYAYGRYAELCGVWLPLIYSSENLRGNAEDWIEAIKKSGKYVVSKTPVLGAVACWKCGKTKSGTDGAGHVAVVEAILPNADIITSNSAYNGTEWFEQIEYAAKGYNWESKKTGKKYEFQGFIYPTINFEEGKRMCFAARRLTLRDIPNGKYLIPLKQFTIPKDDVLKYDGKYTVVGKVKWIHVTWIDKSGWVPEMYVK